MAQRLELTPTVDDNWPYSLLLTTATGRNASFALAKSVERSGHLLLEAHESATCTPGLFFPLIPGEETWPVAIRIVLYAVGVSYCFVGIAIIADIFMAAIEKITSKEKTVSVEGTDGSTHELKFLVWNETVANLTLMALGSSAPEILLAVIEAIRALGKPPSDGLGPSTIVGSAAFNLFCITAVCVLSIPAGETRRIKDIGVFSVTAAFSIVAYGWMLLVLVWISPDEVTLVEALITLAMFPLLVIVAYIQDKGGFQSFLLKRRGSRVLPTQSHLVGTSGMGAKQYGKHAIASALRDRGVTGDTKLNDAATVAYAQRLAVQQTRMTKAKYARLARIQSFAPSTNGEEADIVTKRDRVQSDGSEPSSSDIMDLASALQRGSAAPTPEHTDQAESAVLQFVSSSFGVLESEGIVHLEVVRSGAIDVAVEVRYETSDGSATANADYIPASGVLRFEPGQTQQTISVQIVDDNEFEPDETFFVTLHVPYNAKNTTIGPRGVAEVTVFNDDNPGEFGFEKAEYAVAESSESVEISVIRSNGSDGEIKVKYHTVAALPHSARAGVDFVPQSGTLVFDHGVARQNISISIIDCKSYTKKVSFGVVIELPGFPENGTAYSKFKQTVILVQEDAAFQQLVDKVAAEVDKDLGDLSLRTTSWKEQLDASVRFEYPDSSAPVSAYLMHVLSVGWKVLFATIPPTELKGGWLTFGAALCGIGMLTAAVGDLASLLGCVLGLGDTFTAITIVALGTSLPDTFASQAAARNDQHADAAIGNITGSNSVNVFLGLGLPWTISAIYYAATSGTFVVRAGSLGFSVGLFTGCAFICVSVLYFRRSVAGGGAELGGSKRGRILTAGLFVGLWIVYVSVSAAKIFNWI